MSELLYGHDPEERIVGAMPSGSGRVVVTKRNADGTTEQSGRPVSYLIWTTEGGAGVARREVGTAVEIRKLKTGKKSVMDRLLVFGDRKAYRAVYKTLRDFPAKWPYHTVSNPVDAYLHQTGKTLFKGMKMSDLVRMQIDIETFRIDGFAQAEKDPIIIISLSATNGVKRVLYWRDRPVRGLGFEYKYFETEADMLTELVRWVHRIDPDVIEGHNIFSYDLPYIKTRCEKLGVYFGVGRDGRVPFTHSAEKKFAERDITYTNFIIGGRSVIDTMFLAYDWDVFKRELENFRLKDVAIKIGVAAKDRVYVEGADIAQTWLDDPRALLKYALDDALETQGLSNHFLGSTFALAQMVPRTLQKVHLAGKASTIETLFVREYLRKGQALPNPEPTIQDFGGYTDLFQTGIFERIWYADVASLYPSIMLNYDIRPESDVLGIFRTLLKEMTQMRFHFKRAMNDAEEGSIEHGELEAKQAALKIIINSFYGALGAGHLFLFSHVEEADRVAFTGQQLLKLMMEHIHDAGGDIVEVDTDGVLFVAPTQKNWATDGKDFCQWVSDQMPKGIAVDFDGAYQRMLSFAKKNYALVKPDGSVKIKGGSLKSRGLEPIYRDYINDLLGVLAMADVPKLREVHQKYQAEIVNGTDPARLAKTVTLKDSLAEYENKVNAGGSRRAAYEIAMMLKRMGRRVGKGDRISYVVTGDKKPYKVSSFIDGTLLEEVVPGRENKLYYLNKLFDVAVKRLTPVVAEDDLKRLFEKDVVDPNQTDMFGEYIRTDLLQAVTVKNTRIKDPSTLWNV